MSIQSDESFFQRIDDLRDSVEKILPKTQAADRIEELCGKVKTTYRDVRISGKKSRSPVVAIVADSSRDRRWVVGLLRRRLAQQLNLDRELSDPDPILS